MARGMKRLVPILAALAFSGCDQPGSVNGRACVTIAAPLIRLPIIPGRPGAGYFEIDAPPGQGNLISVTAERIGRIEMHETATSNGVNSMRQLQSMAPDHCGRFATAEGRHLMLFDMDPTLRPGEQVVLTFHFERGEPRRLATSVREADTGHEGH